MMELREHRTENEDAEANESNDKNVNEDRICDFNQKPTTTTTLKTCHD